MCLSLPFPPFQIATTLYRPSPPSACSFSGFLCQVIDEYRMRGRRLYVLCLVKGKKEDVCEGSALCFLQGHRQLLAVLCTNHVCQRQELKHNALWEICIAEFVRCLPEGTFFIRRGVKWPKKKMFLEEVFHKKKRKWKKRCFWK